MRVAVIVSPNYVFNHEAINGLENKFQDTNKIEFSNTSTYGTKLKQRMTDRSKLSERRYLTSSPIVHLGQFLITSDVKIKF